MVQTFPSQKPSSNIEGSAAASFANKAGRGGSSGAAILGGIAALFGKKGKGGSGGGRNENFGYKPTNERSAEDWYNEEHAKRYDFKREGSRRRGTLKDGQRFAGDGRTMRGASADGKGGFKIDWENAPVSPAKPDVVPPTQGPQFNPPTKPKKTKARNATYVDTRRAVTSGDITAEEGIQISPTYAKNYAARESAKKAKNAEKN
jgi:hypothetical protein